MADKNITEDILYAPIRDLGDLLKTRKITSTALTEAYLDRLDKLGEKLGAVVTLMKESALKEAQAADKEIADGKYRGLLHGVPYGVKDLLATKGVRTTWGAEPFKDQVFDYDATVVKKLRAAGAVLVAKLSMVELAGAFGYNTADASLTGPGRTPWNLDFWSGGSSSGPGSAVSAALVAFAIGSETSGSIITPSAYCGVSGLRPTYGRVSRHGAMALCWSLDKLGPMCRTADDCGLVLSVMAGVDPSDPTCVDKPFVFPEKVTKKFKIGAIKDCTKGCQEAPAKNFAESIEVLSQFAEVEENVPFPDLPFGPAVSLIVQAEGASAFRELIESGETSKLRAPNDRFGGQAASMVLAVDYIQAMRSRGPMKKMMDELYSKYDALIAPSRQSVAHPVGKDFDKAYPGIGGGPPIIPAGNAVGQPALSVPNGFGENNLPTGIQFTGRIWSEARLIAVADAYQRATEWHKKRPKV